MSFSNDWTLHEHNNSYNTLKDTFWYVFEIMTSKLYIIFFVTKKVPIQLCKVCWNKCFVASLRVYLKGNLAIFYMLAKDVPGDMKYIFTKFYRHISTNNEANRKFVILISNFLMSCDNPNNPVVILRSRWSLHVTPGCIHWKNPSNRKL